MISRSLLNKHFLGIFNKNFGKSIQGLSDEMMEIFMRYPWPGNIRELRHSMEHVLAFCRGTVKCPISVPWSPRGFVPAFCSSDCSFFHNDSYHSF